MVELLVTYMEQLAPPPGPPLLLPSPDLAINRVVLDPDTYLPIYRAIGAPQSWDQRLLMPRPELERFLASPRAFVFLLRQDGRAIGLCELDGRRWPEVELVNFGLLAEAQGRGLGPSLIDHALREVWRRGACRVWLHTDVWDHPRAQPLYLRLGFRIFEQRVQDADSL